MVWIIGDIHGCRDELVSLVEKLPENDKLVFLGDYIDRGPDSFGVVEFLLSIQKRCEFLSGNHESMLLNFFRDKAHPESEAFVFNGGKETLGSYGLDETAVWEDLPESHRNFYNNLLDYYEGDDFIAAHAGVNVGKGVDMKKQGRQDLLWIRHEWIDNEAIWAGKTVFYGHTPSKRTGSPEHVSPVFGKKSVGLDTGCVYGGSLSAINPSTMELIQIKSGVRT